LEDKGIKHLSFQSYLRQAIPKQNYEKFLKDTSQSDGQVYPPLEEEDYRVKQNCKGGHPPWPASICSKCQPGAITLQRQKFRMVDHIEFSTPKVIETFLEGWRSTGFQRIGVLYGRYESYPEVPLGVKAVVECIYEPPQTGYTDELEIAEQDPDQTQLDEVAKYLGLQVVGVIYTDLFDDGTGTGKVLCKRHLDSYFMSSQEIYFSAKLQNMFKNRCRWSSTKYFGSKFVTCVISGNLSGDIEVEAYQVSNQAMAMIEADIVQPSVQPSSMLVRKSDSTHWVPEIFYKYQNEYKVIVKKNASPAFPVEYLLVNVTHGFPQSPNPIFTSPIHFIPNNRVNERPSVASVHTYFQQGGNIKDFHLLMFLVLSGLLGNEEITKLLNIVKSPLPSDDPGLSREIHRLEHSDAWKTLITLADEACKFIINYLIFLN
jgi:nuclear protein localization family protein 4